MTDPTTNTIGHSITAIVVVAGPLGFWLFWLAYDLLAAYWLHYPTISGTMRGWADACPLVACVWGALMIGVPVALSVHFFWKW